ncbi:MAG: asparagine synthase (glutamine-hydrolyzing) [Alcanivoracaceae bacterium]|nr:asparagine synthase (glutamine-hydrolyzing) [Alcanivoracaceae bacterium]
MAGIWQPDVSVTPLRERLEKMAARISHRGPDDRGVYTHEKLGLAHTRLSIIDVAGGHQPMRAECGLVVSYNGEIFNYIELRVELEQAGWHFKSQSDTEVLLAAYHFFGDEFLSKLNGQFAFALWDEKKQTLLLARDHAGIHPLFISRQGGELVFASEIKALVPVLKNSLQPDHAALDQIFTFWTPLPPATGFLGIEQLAPGECLQLSPQGEKRWTFFQWQYPRAGEERKENLDQLAHELRELLEDAVRIRLRADVPVGCYLSGGLDSSATTALVSHLGQKPSTFSVNFSDPDVDEAQWQQQLYTHLGVEHQALQVSDCDIATQLPRAVWHAERPILRTAPVPMMLLSQHVSSHGFKVVLTGEGADEVFAGYDLFKEAKVRHFWARNPDSAWRWKLLQRLYPWMDLGSLNYLKRFFGDNLQHADSALFSHLPRWRNTAQCKQFFSASMKKASGDAALESVARWMPIEAKGWAPGHHAQYLESRLLMDAYLLSSQGDRMLMSSSVEGRFPFLDPRLVQFANSLAPHQKMPGLNEKALLKRAVADLVPQSILQRPKQPYRAPDATSLANAEYMTDLLSPRSISQAGYFDANKVALLWRKAKAGKLNATRDQMALTGVVSTQIWHQQYIEGKSHFVSAAA